MLLVTIIKIQYF